MLFSFYLYNKNDYLIDSEDHMIKDIISYFWFTLKIINYIQINVIKGALKTKSS